MSRTAQTILLLASGLLAVPAFAQTSPPAAGPSPVEPSYEAETPVLLGSFLEQSGSGAPAEAAIGTSPRSVTIRVAPVRSEPAPPRAEPITTIERKK